MIKYLIPKDGKFYKANLHCHSTLSDGSLTPEQLKDLYKRHGYSAVAFTDHDVFLTHNDLTDDTFVALNGFEAEGNEKTDKRWALMKTVHVCFIAPTPDRETPPFRSGDECFFANAIESRKRMKEDPTTPLLAREYTHEGVSEMMKVGADAGFFVTYNHPGWSVESYAEYSGYKYMHCMEMLNYGCYVEGYPSYEPRVYDDLLRLGNRISVSMTDDNHNRKPEGDTHFDSLGGFVWIKAPALSYENLMGALFHGDFYASMGPEIEEIYFDSSDSTVHLRTSAAASVFMTAGQRRAAAVYPEGRELLREAVFKVSPDDIYVRFTVTDATGKKADTRAYFTDELF